MMGRRGEQGSLFYQFRPDERVPKYHLLRRIDRFVTGALADIHERLNPYYSEIGRPSIDPELMMRMLIVGYRYGLRSERRLTQEVELHLAYRWFCTLSLCTCRRHYPGAASGRIGFARNPAVSAFPDMAVGSACALSFSRFARRSLALRPAHSRCHRIS